MDVGHLPGRSQVPDPSGRPREADLQGDVGLLQEVLQGGGTPDL